MRTETVTHTICAFDELSAEAKEKALTDYRCHADYNWSAEAAESLKAFAEHFETRVRYEVDWANSSYSSAKFTLNRWEEDYYKPSYVWRRLQLLGDYNPETMKGLGVCELTGFCLDDDAIDGMRIAFLGEWEFDILALLEAGFQSWLESAQADYAHQVSDEGFEESCDANGYEFYSDGSAYRGACRGTGGRR
jgi:hypothetical protein